MILPGDFVSSVRFDLTWGLQSHACCPRGPRAPPPGARFSGKSLDQEPLLGAGVESQAGHHHTPHCGPDPREPPSDRSPRPRPPALSPQAVEAWLRQGRRVPAPQAHPSHSFPAEDLPLLKLLLHFQRTSLGSGQGPICPEFLAEAPRPPVSTHPLYLPRPLGPRFLQLSSQGAGVLPPPFLDLGRPQAPAPSSSDVAGGGEQRGPSHSGGPTRSHTPAHWAQVPTLQVPRAGEAGGQAMYETGAPAPGGPSLPAQPSSPPPPLSGAARWRLTTSQYLLSTGLSDWPGGGPVWPSACSQGCWWSFPAVCRAV